MILEKYLLLNKTSHGNQKMYEIKIVIIVFYYLIKQSMLNLQNHKIMCSQIKSKFDLTLVLLNKLRCHTHL